MKTKLYVGNLNYKTSEEDLNTLFGEFGEVRQVNVIRDSHSNRSKGFAFVEMAAGEDAGKALEANGREFMGRPLRVSEARPPARNSQNRPERPPSRGFENRITPSLSRHGKQRDARS